jgi:DNA polymerase III alpha subunit (gram-positive type)
MILKWYLDNYPKQFKLAYINRYRDLDKFENQFKINKADISNSLKNRYLHDEELTAITEPLDVISYLDEKMIDNIILNRPYSSVEDFALKNRMDSELLNKLKTDGYLDSLAKTDQLVISDVF